MPAEIRRTAKDTPPQESPFTLQEGLRIIDRPTEFTVRHKHLFRLDSRYVGSNDFAEKFRSYPFSKSRELSGLSVVEDYSRRMEFGYTAEEITIPNGFAPELIQVSHNQPSLYKSNPYLAATAGNDVLEDRVIFTQGSKMIEYTETTRDSFDSTNTPITVSGINAGLFDLAVAQYIAKDRVSE